MAILTFLLRFLIFEPFTATSCIFRLDCSMGNDYMKAYKKKFLIYLKYAVNKVIFCKISACGANEKFKEMYNVLLSTSRFWSNELVQTFENIHFYRKFCVESEYWHLKTVW